MWEDGAVPNERWLDVHLDEDDALEVSNRFQDEDPLFFLESLLAKELLKVHVVADFLDCHRGLNGLAL